MNGNQILKFDKDGNFIKVLGSKGSGEGQFIHPHGMVFDSNNNMYITDMGNYRIQVFDNNFSLITQWGSYGNGPAQFLKTFPGIDYFDKENILVVVDKTSANVKLFDSKGEFITKFGAKGKEDGQFNRPEDLAVDPKGRIFITDTGNSRIQVFDKI
jgi:DNA-binding beta-propeller fold protein YncE